MSGENPSDPGEQRRLQRLIHRAVDGVVLYERPSCPYCKRVALAVRALGIELQTLDIGKDAAAAQRLEAEGGRRMVPCLYIPDGASGQWLYESADIIDYLRALVEELAPSD